MKLLIIFLLLINLAFANYVIPGTNGRTMICCHGYGGNYEIANKLKGTSQTTLVSFNFPDHDTVDHDKACFGSLQELTPALQLLKKYVVDDGLTSIDLYGFSAGGGAVVNMLAVLETYDLSSIGLSLSDNEQILEALRRGYIILDTPLKSLEEIIEGRGRLPDLEKMAKIYKDNNLRPIDSTLILKNFNIIVFFQNPDHILYNRDDDLFIERLQSANNVTVIIADEGGHNAIHHSLWSHYNMMISKKYFIGQGIRTSNATFMSDIEPLWAAFRPERVPGCLNIMAVYTDYEGDYTKPFTYLVGCEVPHLNTIPAGMTGIEIPAGSYIRYDAATPEALGDCWRALWTSDVKRLYTTDYEVYTDQGIQLYIAAQP